MEPNTPTAARTPSPGIRLSRLNLVIIVVAIAVAALLLIGSHQALDGYRSLETLTERYITCQQNAALFQETSDYLTAECRVFVLTGDVRHAENFCEEIETTRRREQAIAVIEDLLKEADSYGYLSEGLRRSDALAEVELYAMRLAAAAWDSPDDALPGRIRALALTAEDAALPADGQRARAIELLFGEDYQQAKASIHECVANSVNALIDDTRDAQLDASAKLNALLLRQRALIVLLLAIVTAAVLVTLLLVIRPLMRAVAHIREQREIPVAGSAEMRFLARTYNDMYAQNLRSTEELTYSATHDSLTGVFNRTAYDAERRRVDASKVGVLIIDVDKFKTFNDTYGHDVGDAVLKRVAQVITDNFRSNDFVSRIGGDEFCVIMRNADSRLRELVAGKIERANRTLQSQEGGLPRISLSVGVAFGDRENPDGDIFKDADTALYSVKHSGGSGCAFY